MEDNFAISDFLPLSWYDFTRKVIEDKSFDERSFHICIKIHQK